MKLLTLVVQILAQQSILHSLFINQISQPQAVVSIIGLAAVAIFTTYLTDNQE